MSYGKMRPMMDNIAKAYQWYSSPERPEMNALVSQTRDAFQGRLDVMLRQFSLQICPADQAALLTAVVGEIGNNCFDHNLGQWRDLPGCWFDFGHQGQQLWIVVADRGQGILSSLKRVLPDLKSDQEALEIAFQKRISGRSPEKRGNGLKFVRGVINGSETRGLFFRSGSGEVSFGGLAKEAGRMIEPISPKGGTFAAVFWKGS